MPIVHHPFTIDLGPVPITGFGIAVLLAFMIAQIISQQELLRRGYQKEGEAIPDLILACVVGTLVGGKLYYAPIVTQGLVHPVGPGGVSCSGVDSSGR